MSKEKQIEEIKREVNTALARDCSKARCLTCEFINEENCEPAIIAESLYNAGYRKQLEGEWVKDEKSRTLHRCFECGYGGYYNGVRLGVFCSNCGSRMKNGGAMIE